MRALVTGGAGFIGSYLIPELLSRGFDVTAFDLARDPSALASVLDKITYVQGDLSSGPDLYRVMMTEKITDVFHLGSILAGPCEENPQMGFRINMESTLHLLDASVAMNVNRFIMLSSISVFGRDVSEPVVDSAVKNPETIYGQTKLASEHLLKWYYRKHGLDTRALRFTWVFGPGRTRGITALWSSSILDAVARNEAQIISNPDETGDWLYVKDAVKAIMTLYDAKTPTQRIYNIAGGVHSIREVATLAQRLKPEAKITLSEGGGRQSPYPAAYDDSAARRELGWFPSYSIDQAVKEHIEIVSEMN
ncbi:NAD(P)-dependent oxidoreductase [uncultured Desulfosarcina sp.]|uniref:NAD-dependent epimerase/dehydratase family protein n=1 Tax=uncultured Desulfosarcina sp. TaxID=218289 RepID=UPI0029C6C51F|nr:NAD(P)-dependent oxidoreductase [uncultured Desulfosarcina sp.]